VWHLASQGRSSDDIADELRRYPNGIAQKYLGRLDEEVLRSYRKWQGAGHAGATGSTTAAKQPWPQIVVRSGELPRIVNEAEQALLQLNREIYQRGGEVVRPVIDKLRAADDRTTEGWRLISVDSHYLVETLSRAARFLSPSKKKKGGQQTFSQVDCPAKVAVTYLRRRGEWQLPVLAGIVTTPVMRRDGSILDQPGYDPSTCLLFKPGKTTFPPIPTNPTKQDALAALKLLKDAISTFPFTGKADLAVALSGFITPLHRRMIATAPMHAFNAPAARTGKSKLVNGFSIVVTGEEMPVLSPSNDDKELDKQLGAELHAGADMLSLDNWDRPLKSARLCQVLTEQSIAYRVFVVNDAKRVPTGATVYCTGNNLVIAGDLASRTLRCTIDANCAHPERRRFANNFVDMVRNQRGVLVVAALTVLRAWHITRLRGVHMNVEPFGGFEDWNEQVREALVWLGEADPVDTVRLVQDTDPETEALEEVVDYWKNKLGVGYKTHEILARAMNIPDFYSALINAAGYRGNIDARRLGDWLRFRQGRVVSSGLKIVGKQGSMWQKVWVLQKA
jgi:hypothetical protein